MLEFFLLLIPSSVEFLAKAEKIYIDNVPFLNQKFTSFSLVYAVSFSFFRKKSYLRIPEGHNIFQEMSQEIEVNAK